MTTYPPFLSFQHITAAFYFVLFAIKSTTTYPLFLPLERIAAAFRFDLLATTERRPTLLFSPLSALMPHSISFFLLSKVRRPTLFFSLLSALLPRSIFRSPCYKSTTTNPPFLSFERIPDAFLFSSFCHQKYDDLPSFSPS